MKKGISLIVLVITIIVMIILAAAVVITLNNTGIIGRANDAVDKTNLKEVQNLATLIWSEEFMDNKRGDTLKEAVLGRLEDYTDDYDIDVTDEGIQVESKVKYTGPTFGSLINSADDYGKTVEYTVTVDGKKYTEWQLYYHTNEYVFIIAKNSVGEAILEAGLTLEDLTDKEKELYEKYRLNNSEKFELKAELTNTNESGETENIKLYNTQMVVQLIKHYGNYANTKEYGSKYVIGAIGAPTIELLAAGWNAKGNLPAIKLTTNYTGYLLNGESCIELASDGLYLKNSEEDIWLASHSSGSENSLIFNGAAGLEYDKYGANASHKIRPVICLSADIPAISNGTIFSLIKNSEVE